MSGEGPNAFALGRYGIQGVAETPQSMAERSAIGRVPVLPSFIVVGPPRTGTTWLHEVLTDRTNLPSPTKETRFFDLHFDRGLSWYLDHFPAEHDTLPFGEVAPTYFASPEARERIVQTIPTAKLVFIFRHPVQRLVSLYRLKRAYGMVSGTLEQALEQDPELVTSSKYATNLRAWQDLFPADQLSINLFEDLNSDPQSFIDRIASFLEIPQFQLQESQLGQVYSTTRMTEPRNYLATKAASAMADWCKARKLDNVVAGVRNSNLINLFLGGGAPFPEIPLKTMRDIWELLLHEIEELEGMLGRDLSHWKTPPAAVTK